jgi:hypothetical protein
MPSLDSVFASKGVIRINQSILDKIFVSLSKSIPFICSNTNSFITSFVSKNLEKNFEPTYFQIPFIYSAVDNLFNGNYKESSSIEDNIIISKYEIPYKGKLKEEIVNIVTYFNNSTNILFYEIPREFTYNSFKQASVAITSLNDGSFSGKILIPATFTSLLFSQYPSRFLSLTINTNENNSNLAEVSVSEPLYPLCQGQYLGTTQDPNDICYPCGIDKKWAIYYLSGVQCAMCPDGENIIDDNYIPTTLCTIPP